MSLNFPSYKIHHTLKYIFVCDISRAVAEAKEKKGESKRPPKVDTTPSLLARFIAEETVTGTYSRYRGLAPANCPAMPPAMPVTAKAVRGAEWTNAKKVLDSSGPEALAQWVVAQKKVDEHICWFGS